MHKSKIFLLLCFSFIIGVFIGSYIVPLIGEAYAKWDAYKIPLFFGILIFSIILITCWRPHKKPIIIGFCLIVFVLGVWRFDSVSPASALAELQRGKSNIKEINIANNVNIEFIGIISDNPDIRSDQVKITVKMEKTKILITTKKFPKYKYGDKLKINGKIMEPKVFEDFNYKAYLSRYGITHVMYDPKIEIMSQGHGNFVLKNLFKIRGKFESSINKILPEPHSSFLAGLLLGAKRGIPKDLLDSFNITGTTHIIAISGYNITIIALLLLSIFNALSINRKYAFWFSVIGIWGFIFLTGASASVVRAGIMGMLVLLAMKSGRLSNITNAIVLTAGLMIFINPLILRFDMGFQLSFLATLGLVYVMPLMEKFFPFLPEKFAIKESLLGTMSAQITAVPLIIYEFGRLSLIAPIANILILPLIPFTMLIGFVSGIIGLIWIPLAEFLAWPAWLFLMYEIKVVELLSKIPYADIEISGIHWAWMILYYILLIIFIHVFNRKNKKIYF